LVLSNHQVLSQQHRPVRHHSYSPSTLVLNDPYDMNGAITGFSFTDSWSW